jgi:hypothetical protein
MASDLDILKKGIAANRVINLTQEYKWNVGI